MIRIHILDQVMTTQTLAPVDSSRLLNITTALMNTTITNTSPMQGPPDVESAFFNLLYAYDDAIPGWGLLLVFSIPFLLLYTATGSLRVPSIVGILIGVAYLAFLPDTARIIAGICIVISIGTLAWGLFKE